MLLEKLQKLIYLIERKQTGRPRALAEQLGVSRRMVYVYLGILRNQIGAPIAFDQFKQSFVWEYNGTLEWQFAAKASVQPECDTLKNKQLLLLTSIVRQIHAGNTGSTKEFAKQLSIAERSLYNYMDVLRNLFHCPIRFDRKTNSYVFENEGTVNFLWENTDCNIVAQT